MTTRLPSRAVLAVPSRVSSAYMYGSASGPSIIPTTWNPSDKHTNVTLSEGNTKMTKTGIGFGGVRSIFSVSAGKYYFEITGSSTNSAIGLANASALLNTHNYGTDYWALREDGAKNCDGGGSGGTAWGTGYGAGDTIGFALDMDNYKLFATDNSGNWQQSQDPVAGSNAMCTTLSGETVFLFAMAYGSSDWFSINTGQAAFSYTVPSGYYSGFGDLG